MNHRRPNSRFCRSGLTLLEMVLSVMILGIVAATLMQAVGYVIGVEARTRRLIAANELANRLILQYFDDDKAMPDRSRPLEYGDHIYGWDIEVQTVTMDLSNPVRDSMSAMAIQFLSRFKLLTITVYEAERGPSGGLILGEPMATLSRTFDPTVVRNPDAMSRWGEDRIQQLVGTLTGAASLDIGEGGNSQGLSRGRAGSSRDRSDRSSRR